MTGSQTIRNAGRELEKEIPQHPDAPSGVTERDWQTFFTLLERITNDEIVVGCRHKRLLVENKARSLECDTALEEFVDWFHRPCCAKEPCSRRASERLGSDL